MIPKKAVDMIPEFAQKEGIPEQDAKDIILGYYTETKRILTNLEKISVEVTGLGYFMLRHNKVDKAILRLRGIVFQNRFKLSQNQIMPFRVQLDQLEGTIPMREVEWARQKVMKEVRAEYKRNKERILETEHNEDYELERDFENGMGK